ncbi:hypothetical protein QYE76_016390 [Lolium multiflorum]|uniref:Uncharacterized protein n=1 Tax=Lolium multiflorum TaxID=4521 RepID=A0AAD8QL40_LOLMU|nr:hypothetical protein QYE76_016390 [Lolium multiflorum]
MVGEVAESGGFLLTKIFSSRISSDANRLGRALSVSAASGGVLILVGDSVYWRLRAVEPGKTTTSFSSRTNFKAIESHPRNSPHPAASHDLPVPAPCRDGRGHHVLDDAVRGRIHHARRALLLGPGPLSLPTSPNPFAASRGGGRRRRHGEGIVAPPPPAGRREDEGRGGADGLAEAKLVVARHRAVRGLSGAARPDAPAPSSSPPPARSVTDDDLDELRGCLDLGFEFEPPAATGCAACIEGRTRLVETLPALDLYYAVAVKGGVPLRPARLLRLRIHTGERIFCRWIPCTDCRRGGRCSQQLGCWRRPTRPPAAPILGSGAPPWPETLRAPLAGSSRDDPSHLNREAPRIVLPKNASSQLNHRIAARD